MTISLALLGLGAGGRLAEAAAITFATPVAITTADATLAVDTNIVGAATFGPNSATVTTATHPTGILFTNNGSVATVIAADGTTAQALTGALTGNTNFDTVLNNFAYDGKPTVIQLQGLTVGQAYVVQLFGLDDRATAGTRTIAFSDGTNQSSQFVENSNVYVIGTFTADAATQNIQSIGFGYPGNPGDTGSNFNAVVVNTAAVPEPASLSLLGLGGLGLLVRRRRA